jgi:hypothetical protein
MRSAVRALLVACLAVGGASCGDDGNDAIDSGGGIDGAGGVVTVTDCTGLTPVMTIETVGTTGFSPNGGNVTISVGDTIRFDPTTNLETLQHSMQSTRAKVPFTTPLAMVACITFHEAGSFPYKCSVHQDTTGTVTVN